MSTSIQERLIIPIPIAHNFWPETQPHWLFVNLIQIDYSLESILNARLYEFNFYEYLQRRRVVLK